MGRGSLPSGNGYTTANSSMTATVLRLNPSNPTEASALIQADIADKLGMTPPRYLIDVDHDGGSDDAVILMSLLYHTAGNPTPNIVARCWSASNAQQAESGLTAAIAAAGADADSNYVRLHGLAGCGQGHQFLGYLITSEDPGP